MELQHLPRAERVFKKYVDSKIEELIKQSQDISQKYIERRQQLLQRINQIQQSRNKVENYLFILEKALSLSPAVREQIQQTKGLSDVQLRDLINDLQQILSKYDQQKQLINFDLNSSQDNIERTEKIQELEERSQDQHLHINTGSKISNQKLIKIALNCLQSISSLLCLLAIAFFLYRNL